MGGWHLAQRPYIDLTHHVLTHEPTFEASRELVLYIDLRFWDGNNIFEGLGFLRRLGWNWGHCCVPFIAGVDK
jgi:hypothetical protein